MSAWLGDISLAFGGAIETLESAAARGALSAAPAALRAAGFVSRNVATDECAIDLARRALAPLAEERRDAGALVIASVLPLRGGDPTASDMRARVGAAGAQLAADLGLDRALAFELTGQACTGALGALRVARGLIAAEPSLAPVLVVASDVLPGGVRVDPGHCLSSDGAAACVVSARAGGARIVRAASRTHAAWAGADDDAVVGMFFPVAHALVRETLEAAGRRPGDLAALVLSNLPDAACRILARTLEMDECRAWAPTRATHGHVMGADPLINLHALRQADVVRAGDLVLMLALGYGLVAQALLLEVEP
jgi:3-oxoacyl-[acyl-carrier-protein] synthase-3